MRDYNILTFDLSIFRNVSRKAVTEMHLPDRIKDIHDMYNTVVTSKSNFSMHVKASMLINTTA